MTARRAIWGVLFILLSLTTIMAILLTIQELTRRAWSWTGLWAFAAWWLGQASLGAHDVYSYWDGECRMSRRGGTR